MYLRSEFRVVMSVTISASTRCSVRLYLQLFVAGNMSYLRYFICSREHVLFTLFVFVAVNMSYLRYLCL